MVELYLNNQGERSKSRLDEPSDEKSGLSKYLQVDHDRHEENSKDDPVQASLNQSCILQS
jgi:hypothetical protein